MTGEDRLDELAAELGRLGEQLADAAMDLLRAGLAEGTEAASARATRQERLVNRARSSLEKAVRLLSEAGRVAGEPAADAVGDGDDTTAGEEAELPRRRSALPEPPPWETA